MAWSTTQMTQIIYSGTTYSFAPNVFIYVGSEKLDRNQIVQESESGEIKIQELDTTTREMYEFALNLLPFGDYSDGTTTLRGFNTLRTLIETTLNFRENNATISLAGDTIGTTHDVRYWASTFGPHPLVRDRGTNKYFGNGSTVVSFREEV